MFICCKEGQGFFFFILTCVDAINSSTRHFSFMRQKNQSSKLKMSLTNLPCVLWCSSLKGPKMNKY